MPLELVLQMFPAEAAVGRAVAAAMTTPTHARAHVTAAAALDVVLVAAAAAAALISDIHTVMAGSSSPGSQLTATVFLPGIH